VKERIELHDSSIESIHVNGDQITINFDSLVILNVTDEFGFEFDNTRFTTGKFSITGARYEGLPPSGEISSGHLRVGECRFGLLPLDLSVAKPCMLYIAQASGEYQIFGVSIKIQID
jgi:hypothetical protein